jgi:TldD protein
VKEQKFFASLEGAATLQQRVLLHPELSVVVLDRDGWRADAMRTLAPPAARGWEYVAEQDGWHWDAELAALPDLVAERLHAPPVQPGVYDLVVDPTNLWRTIHETVGHATEIDRVLGHEVTLTGGTFASPLRLGSLEYGSELMNITGDRTTEFGCATVGFDDDGVPASSWDLVQDGVLVGFQVDRATAAAAGEERSNGCSHAPSAVAAPGPRCANVSLTPYPDGPDTDDLISAVDRGLFVIGDAGFTIDSRCLAFRAGAQRVYEIVAGEVRGQVRDAVYTGSTPAFWSALTAIGGPQTFLLGGTSACGKGSPRETAWAGHGSPAALFSNIAVVRATPGPARPAGR